MLIVPREESQEGKLRQKFHLLCEIIWSAQKRLSGFYLSNQQCFNPENVKLVCCWSIQPLQVVDTTLRACLINHRGWELQGETKHTSRRRKQWKFRHRTFLSLHHEIPSTSFHPKGKMQRDWEARWGDAYELEHTTLSLRFQGGILPRGRQLFS